MFNKILIANRGEIACRVMKTAQRLGIRCVAVYSDADQHARHTQIADEAYYLGGNYSADSYLCGDKIIAIAKKSGAQAIHPGYGFLSENAEFAQLCQDHGLVFIGAPAAAILAMGSKSHAKQLMTNAKVPILPGYHGEDQTADFLKKTATQIGYPILIKAAFGGGGKGMRIVHEEKEFAYALESAKREATTSFGNDQVLIEKYLENPRHIEIQIFGDMHGNYVHLFERDCSIQRRHQKVIEEAPAPGLSEDIRQRMGAAAVAAAKAVNYTGAGTIEFLLAGTEQFYFMEMNTRLQVEHPITEMITGQDLVEWQLCVASGGTLPLTQAELQIQGHAFECRLYAEDPENQFLPSTGKIQYLLWPEENSQIRIDTGIRAGDRITPYYDPMIAKLIVWGKDRPSALSTLDKALWNCHILGLKNNLAFLRALIALPDYQQAKVTTHFIPQHEADLQADHQTPKLAYALGVLFILLTEQKNAGTLWQATDGWRLNLPYQRELFFQHDEHKIITHVTYLTHGYLIQLADVAYEVNGELSNANLLTAYINGQMMKLTVVQDHEKLYLFGDHFCQVIEYYDAAISSIASHDAKDKLTSPMPGTIIAILQKSGVTVDKGTPLMIIEAMKMEHTIYAPSRGTIKEVYFAQGDQVQEGVNLLEFDIIA